MKLPFDIKAELAVGAICLIAGLLMRSGGGSDLLAVGVIGVGVGCILASVVSSATRARKAEGAELRK